MTEYAKTRIYCHCKSGNYKKMAKIETWASQLYAFLYQCRWLANTVYIFVSDWLIFRNSAHFCWSFHNRRAGFFQLIFLGWFIKKVIVFFYIRWFLKNGSNYIVALFNLFSDDFCLYSLRLQSHLWLDVTWCYRLTWWIIFPYATLNPYSNSEKHLSRHGQELVTSGSRVCLSNRCCSRL